VTYDEYKAIALK